MLPQIPVISIVIPNYNTAQFLPRCLDSLIKQTLSNLEIICIDNNSTDNSLEILNQYAKKDNRIKVLSETTPGAAVARNLGLDNATGKYIMFCDSDDWYELNMCEIMYKTIEQKRVDVVCCHTFVDLEDGLNEIEKSTRAKEKYYNSKKRGKFSVNDTIRFKMNMLCNKICRRDLIEKYGIRFPVGHENEDDAFWFMYSFTSNSIYYMRKKLYHYFIRQGSVMSNQINKKHKNKMDRIMISNYVFDFLIKHNLFDIFKDSMLKIYCSEFKGSSSLFSEEEKQQLCKDLNKRLEPYTKEAISLIYCDDIIIPAFCHKSVVQLYLEKYWYFAKYCLSKNDIRRNKCKSKLKQTLIFLKRKDM